MGDELREKVRRQVEDSGEKVKKTELGSGQNGRCLPFDSDCKPPEAARTDDTHHDSRIWTAAQLDLNSAPRPKRVIPQPFGRASAQSRSFIALAAKLSRLLALQEIAKGSSALVAALASLERAAGLVRYGTEKLSSRLQRAE
jgi:hypothetical protein